MKISQLIGSTTTILVTTIGISSVAHAITIRHDVSDREYLTLGNAYPSVGVMSARNDPYFCSGTLVTPRWVLTAAHCVGRLARFGSFNIGRSTYGIARSRAYQHPIWRANRGNFFKGVDLALLQLNRPVRNVRPALLFPRRWVEIPRRRRVGIYVGFGYTGTGSAGYTEQRFRQKRGAYNKIDAYGSRYGWSRNLLLSDFDNPVWLGDFENPLGFPEVYNLEGSIAPGDSGGGLFINGRLAGVNSFVYANPTSFADDTPDSDYGDVMAATRVRPFIPWIRNTIIRGNLRSSSSLSLPNSSETSIVSFTNSKTEVTSSATKSQSIPEPSMLGGLLAIAGFFGLVRQSRNSHRK